MNAASVFWYLILGAQREGSRLLAEGLRPLGLTPAQAEVLGVLAVGAPLTLIALGERLVCETGSPSRLVAGMIRAEWVARRPAPGDKRAVLLSLTDAGADKAAQAAAVTAEFERELEGLLDGLPVEAANRALWRLVAHLPAGRALRRRRGMPSAAARPDGGGAPHSL